MSEENHVQESRQSQRLESSTVEGLLGWVWRARAAMCEELQHLRD